MDVDKGHLLTEEKLKEQNEEMRKLYEPVPKELERAARQKLAGQDEAYVSLTSGGKLSKWAAKRRKVKKMQKESRKKNR